ncbi:MAG TPA: PAS domain-containing protein [Actinomycetota bacterium]|nr:PAS domain-containing protein [Actinomycetota bacterium]
MQPVAHEVATKELAEHLRPLFDASPDGMYVWLDEEHWICNRRLAELFGFDSPDELNDTPNFLQRMVHEDDQQHFSWNYRSRVQAQAFPATFRFRGKRRDGSDIQLETDMIPLTFGGHTFAYHFVRTVA